AAAARERAARKRRDDVRAFDGRPVGIFRHERAQREAPVARDRRIGTRAASVGRRRRAVEAAGERGDEGERDGGGEGEGTHAATTRLPTEGSRAEPSKS